MALKETVRQYMSKKSFDLDGQPVARLNIIVQADSQKEADEKAEKRMLDFFQDGTLGKCHHKQTDKGITHYCYMAY